MAVNYAALKIEIALPAYNGMNDATIAATINAQSVSGLRAVDPSQAMIQLMRIGDWGWLAGVALGYVTSANASGAGAVAVSATTPWLTRRTAQTIYDLLRSNLTLDMTVQANVDAVLAALNVLVTANVITAAGRTAVVALPTTALSGWTKFADRPLDYADIALARIS